MNTYTYTVEQTIEIKANSPEEAEGLLPMYPTGYEGQAHYVTEETVELLSEREGE
jgi:phage-related baseplate assembly protein